MWLQYENCFHLGFAKYSFIKNRFVEITTTDKNEKSEQKYFTFEHLIK